MKQDFHCGGSSIRFWDDGSTANYGVLSSNSECEKVCDMHIECAGFVYDGRKDTANSGNCGHWKRGPLNLFAFPNGDCYEKPIGSTTSYHN